MTAYTLTKNTNIRDLTVAGGYSARTGGDTIANTNGWSFTIDQDTQYGYGAPAFAATTAGSFGNITQTVGSGGDILIDGTKVWLIPFNTGSGTLVPVLAAATISDASVNTVAVYTALTAAPATTGASGWLKVILHSGSLPSSGSFTTDGFSYTITGAAVRGTIEIVGDDAGTFSGARLGKFQVTGAYYEIGTTTGTRSTTYNVPNNGKQLYIPMVEVQGATWTVNGGTSVDGYITVSTSATHDMCVGQLVTITGCSPGGFNVVDAVILDVGDTWFTTNWQGSYPGDMTVGGTCSAYEQYPCAGTLTATSTNVYDENSRRGKVFWNTNATTSLTQPLGYIRFGHDGTNSTGGYCPPSGRKIRIPNVIFTNCTTTARNQNVLPNSTLGTRYDFTMTNAGQIFIDKATMCWYLSATQAQTVQLTNSGFMSQILISEVPTTVILKNVCIGPEAAVTGVSPVSFSLNPAGTIMHSVTCTQAATTGTGAAANISIATSSNVEMIDCVAWCLAIRTGTLKSATFDRVTNLTQKRLRLINQNLVHLNCPNLLCTDTKYTDTTGLRVPATQAQAIFLPQGPLTNGKIEGLSFVGYRAWNQSTLLSPSNSVRGPLKIRNMGTADSPLLSGDGPFYNKSWTRSATTCTVTHTSHGFVTNDVIGVYWNSSAGAISLGVKTITVTNADAFTFSCTNANDASGTLSYYLVGTAGIMPASAAGNLENILCERLYFKFLRGATNALDNSSGLLKFENVTATFDPCLLAVYNSAALSVVGKYTAAAITNFSAVSCYGTQWIEGPTAIPLMDTNTFTWTRSSASITCTTSTGYHNQPLATTNYVEVITSDSDAALNPGVYALTAPSASGTTADKFIITGYNAGAASGNATILPEGGRISIAMNEASSTMQSYTVTSGNPVFTGSGLLRMPTVGDQIVFESPYFIKGHTGFMNTVPVMNTGTIANFHIEYAIDHGSGYGAWKNAFRQSTTTTQDGTAGQATITQNDAADTWMAVGDCIACTTAGSMHRSARIASGVGTTTLTVDKNHNTTFTNNALMVWGLCNENASIDAAVGFKLKIRITTVVANTGSANTIGTLYFRTFTTTTSRATVYPLDSVSLTLTANTSLEGAEVRIYDNETGVGYGTELDGTESCNGSTFTYLGTAGNAITIQVMQTGYEEYTQNVIMPSSSSSLTIFLQAELNN